MEQEILNETTDDHIIEKGRQIPNAFPIISFFSTTTKIQIKLIIPIQSKLSNLFIQLQLSGSKGKHPEQPTMNVRKISESNKMHCLW